MRTFKVKFEGEALIEADDLTCVKDWLERNPDLTNNEKIKEYVKISNIQEFGKCKSCGKDTTTDCSMCGGWLCADIKDCKICPCMDK